MLSYLECPFKTENSFGYLSQRETVYCDTVFVVIRHIGSRKPCRNTLWRQDVSLALFQEIRYSNFERNTGKQERPASTVLEHFSSVWEKICTVAFCRKAVQKLTIPPLSELKSSCIRGKR